MPHFSDQPAQPEEQNLDSGWLSNVRALLESLATAERGVEATLGRLEISAADSPAIDFLAEQVESGFVWLGDAHTTVHTEVSIELRAALGVLRNLAFALRRLSMDEDRDALRRSCEALVEQGHLHLDATLTAVDEAQRHLQ